MSTPAHSPVPPPTVTITGSPLDERFHVGLALTFTGRAEFNPAVNSPLPNVEPLWLKTAPSSNLTTDERVSISEAMMVGVDPTVLESNLTISPLRVGDVGTYTLSFTISSTSTVGTAQRIITEVLGKSCMT